MIYCIVGPTCSGKTEVAKRIASFLRAPIISADAFQIYRDMNIGTAKIEQSDEFYQSHYLIDIINPDQEYSVKQYQDDFRHVFETLKVTYQNIVIVGGTGLYLRAALYDYVFYDDVHSSAELLEQKSNNELFDMLTELDPHSASKIHINNRKRLIRAIDIALNNAKTKSEIISEQKHNLYYKDDIRFYFLCPNRDKLYENINKRTDVMIKNGLVDEVKNLLEKYQLSTTAKQAIGYKEIISYLNGEMTLETATELIKKRTRNYAKRQITFFKHQFPTKMYSSGEEIIKEIYEQNV